MNFTSTPLHEIEMKIIRNYSREKSFGIDDINTFVYVDRTSYDMCYLEEDIDDDDDFADIPADIDELDEKEVDKDGDKDVINIDSCIDEDEDGDQNNSQ